MSPYAKILRRRSEPLVPQATEIEPKLHPLPGIRAALFDIYGTLIISGSGDVGTTSMVGRGEALASAFAELGISFLGQEDRAVEIYRETIAAHHGAARKRGVEHPEVEIIDVWQEVCKRLAEHNEFAIPDTGIDFGQLAVEYESRVNPTWPMPEMEACLGEMRSRKLLLGLISNAQFYTPELFPALLDKSLDRLGFDPHLRYYSYEHRQAKPGLLLFRLAVKTLEKLGLQPAEVVYIGNDLRNDIWPAAQVGFQTVLFAGDARSLRLRQDDPQLVDVQPDAIITKLAQLPPIVFGQ